MSQPLFRYMHSISSLDRDLAHSAREIERLMRLKDQNVTFTPRDLVARLEKSLVFTVWRVATLRDPIDDNDWALELDWRHLDAAIFLKQAPSDEILAWHMVSDPTLHILGDPNVVTPHSSGDPLLFGLYLVRVAHSTVNRSYQAPFDLKQMRHFRIPHALLVDFPHITLAFKDEIEASTGDFVCDFNA